MLEKIKEYDRKMIYEDQTVTVTIMEFEDDEQTEKENWVNQK